MVARTAVESSIRGTLRLWDEVGKLAQSLLYQQSAQPQAADAKRPIQPAGITIPEAEDSGPLRLSRKLLIQRISACPVQATSAGR